MGKERSVTEIIRNCNETDGWDTLMFLYGSALKQMRAKSEIINDEFRHVHGHDLIRHIETRVKTRESIEKKLKRRGHEITLENMALYINDIAGMRLICSFISDIYCLADMIAGRNDFKVLSVKDYIRTPKKSGYKSYHMLVSVPVYLSDAVTDIKAEIQIRTVSMDFWANFEHKVFYKFEGNAPDFIISGLEKCAGLVSQLDDDMLGLNEELKKYNGDGCGHLAGL